MATTDTDAGLLLHKSRYMDEICPGLFLGSRYAVNSPTGQVTLAENGITHILSVEWSKPNVGSLVVEHKFICVDDMPGVDILRYFEECIDFIEEGLTSGKVLVHCMMGISRSSTIVIAYLMHRDKITFKEAFDLVKKQHPRTSPNAGFVDLLHLFEAMGCQCSPTDPLYRQHKLGQLAQDMHADSQIPADMIADDPQENVSDQTQTIYKCRKCRRAVFVESSVLAHLTGKGQASFQWHKQTHPHGVVSTPSSTVDSTASSCTSLFVEPVKWMEPLMMGLMEGKLSCPKCSGKLGSFNWAGVQCSCGTWVTPAFQIHQNRVDKVSQKLPVTSQGGEEERK